MPLKNFDHALFACETADIECPAIVDKAVSPLRDAPVRSVFESRNSAIDPAEAWPPSSR